MQQRTTRVNPSEETIKVGPLGIRFLLTGDDSGGPWPFFLLLEINQLQVPHCPSDSVFTLHFAITLPEART